MVRIVSRLCRSFCFPKEKRGSRKILGMQRKGGSAWRLQLLTMHNAIQLVESIPVQHGRGVTIADPDVHLRKPA